MKKISLSPTNGRNLISRNFNTTMNFYKTSDYGNRPIHFKTDSTYQNYKKVRYQPNFESPKCFSLSPLMAAGCVTRAIKPSEKKRFDSLGRMKKQNFFGVRDLTNFEVELRQRKLKIKEYQRNVTESFTEP